LGKWEKDPDAKKAVEDFAQWFDKCFTIAIAKAQILNLQGQGSVPSYAPPHVLTGPVVDGNIIPSPVIFSGLEF
jgi:hypothetical protein